MACSKLLLCKPTASSGRFHVSRHSLPVGSGRNASLQAWTRVSLYKGRSNLSKHFPLITRGRQIGAISHGTDQHCESAESELPRLSGLMLRLEKARTLQDKLDVVRGDWRTVRFFSTRAGHAVDDALDSFSAEQQFAICCLPAIGQEHILQLHPEGEDFRTTLMNLAGALCRVEVFYNSIGGIVGYQRKSMEMLLGNIHQAEHPCVERTEEADVRLHIPRGPDLAGPNGREIAAQAAAIGLEALPHMAEIIPLGGAGDRLNLKCSRTGDCLPTAMLPYCGRTLIEHLIRDLQAREYLYYKLNGTQEVTPVAVMTSAAKGNHWRMEELMNALNWFGRGKDSFRLFKQPLVPMVSAEDGSWLLSGPLRPLMKPGGHGVIWKLMLDEGIFDWLSHRDREAAIVRQISNPMAGTDATLLALSGTGYSDGRSFGFAACERAVGAAEGMNVLMERRLERAGGNGHEYAYNVTNVEYTEFERLGICDECADGSKYSRFPANTNVLYVGLQAVEAAVRAGVAEGGGAALPGIIFNAKKKAKFLDPNTGEQRSVHAGRMECTMQNLVDSLSQRFWERLPEERHSELGTFVVFNERKRVTSSAKRQRAPGSTAVHQTPDGSFLDLMRNAHDMLSRCNFQLPEVGSVEEFLERGPGFICLFHPALGPLWDIVAQKLQGGMLAPRAELVLEVAEAHISNLRVDGSLRIRADAVMGRVENALAVNCSQLVALHDIEISQMKGRGIWRPAKEPPLALHREFSQITGNSGRGVDGGASPSPPKPPPPFGNGHRVPGARKDSERLVYSARCGRVRLHEVTVSNRGIDWDHPQNVYWRHQVHRNEGVDIILHGQAEFEASNVVLEGSHTFEVPDGYRMTVGAGPAGKLVTSLQPLHGRRPTWQWQYSKGVKGEIKLRISEEYTHAPLQKEQSIDGSHTFII